MKWREKYRLHDGTLIAETCPQPIITGLENIQRYVMHLSIDGTVSVRSRLTGDVAQFRVEPGPEPKMFAAACCAFARLMEEW